MERSKPTPDERDADDFEIWVPSEALPTWLGSLCGVAGLGLAGWLVLESRDGVVNPLYGVVAWGLFAMAPLSWWAHDRWVRVSSESVDLIRRGRIRRSYPFREWRGVRRGFGGLSLVFADGGRIVLQIMTAEGRAVVAALADLAPVDPSPPADAARAAGAPGAVRELAHLFAFPERCVRCEAATDGRWPVGAAVGWLGFPVDVRYWVEVEVPVCARDRAKRRALAIGHAAFSVVALLGLIFWLANGELPIEARWWIGGAGLVAFFTAGSTRARVLDRVFLGVSASDATREDLLTLRFTDVRYALETAEKSALARQAWEATLSELRSRTAG